MGQGRRQARRCGEGGTESALRWRSRVREFRGARQGGRVNGIYRRAFSPSDVLGASLSLASFVKRRSNRSSGTLPAEAIALTPRLPITCRASQPSVVPAAVTVAPTSTFKSQLLLATTFALRIFRLAMPTQAELASLTSASLSGVRSSSATRAATLYQPVLNLSAGHRATIKSRQEAVVSSAVAFHHSAVLHTVLESRSDAPLVTLRLNDIDPDHAPYLLPETSRALWNALFPYFAKGRDAPVDLDVEVVLPVAALDASLLALGATRHDTFFKISRSAMFQLFDYAMASSRSPLFPYLPVSTSGSAHPLRPMKPNPSSMVYSRHISHLNSYFKLHVAGPNDLSNLHQWLNDERVDLFWQEKGSLEQHEKFLAERTSDPHVLPVIGSYVETTTEGIQFKEEPATYAEIYWVKEDRLGPLMKEVRDYDRGLHMLVGSNAHRGPHRVRAWMPSLVHYCFVDEPRTERVVCEPNAKNDKIIKYLESIGFKRQGEVEFPHKTAALMIVDRANFYELCPF